MLTNISEDLKKIFLFGVGAVAITAEKSKILIDELVEKGEITVEQGKILNEELKHNIKETIRDTVTVNVVKSETPPSADEVMEGLDKMTPEEIQKIKDKLEAMSAEKPAEEEIVEVDVKEDVNAK
jgi:polyhydroxyalkanoate synthesis regulator phasin